MYAHWSTFQAWEQMDVRLGSHALQETIEDIQDTWVDEAESKDQVSVILEEKNNQNSWTDLTFTIAKEYFKVYSSFEMYIQVNTNQLQD